MRTPVPPPPLLPLLMSSQPLIGLVFECRVRIARGSDRNDSLVFIVVMVVVVIIVVSVMLVVSPPTPLPATTTIDTSRSTSSGSASSSRCDNFASAFGFRHSNLQRYSTTCR